MLAREHPSVAEEFSNQFHVFWSTSDGHKMWDPENDPDQCVGSGATGTWQCCDPWDKAAGGGFSEASGTTPWLLYHEDKQQCCHDGTVKDLNQEC